MENEPIKFQEDENDYREPDEEAREAMGQLLFMLVQMDRRAKEQGHSLGDMIVKLAKDSYGIDVMPKLPEVETTAIVVRT